MAAVAACGLPSFSSFHTGVPVASSSDGVGYRTSSSPVPRVVADGPSSAQTGAALGRALASVCVSSFEIWRFFCASVVCINMLNLLHKWGILSQEATLW